MEVVVSDGFIMVLAKVYPCLLGRIWTEVWAGSVLGV